MAFRILTNKDAFRKPQKSVQEKSYADFIRGLPCVVRGSYSVQAAHLNTRSRKHGHTGRGGAQRADSRWLIPLCQEEHAIQTQSGNSGEAEMSYWQSQQIDPHRLCLALYSAWSMHKEDAREVCIEIIELAKS